MDWLSPRLRTLSSPFGIRRASQCAALASLALERSSSPTKGRRWVAGTLLHRFCVPATLRDYKLPTASGLQHTGMVADARSQIFAIDEPRETLTGPCSTHATLCAEAFVS